jgi:hypothetical protein
MWRMDKFSTHKIEEWDESYKRGDNYVWYPHEEIIRFISNYVKKGILIDERNQFSVSFGFKKQK